MQIAWEHSVVIQSKKSIFLEIQKFFGSSGSMGDNLDICCF